ncbi:MAG: hypothetical protein JW795_02885 [Chitinivibrionales bacterium]|nr:hypothetical protein [Chitinivibrionales bacterium]
MKMCVQPMRVIVLIFMMLAGSMGLSFAADVTMSGVRIGKYSVEEGIPFPTPRGWHNAINKMHDYFPQSQRYTIWTLGEMWGDDSTECLLYFPSSGKTYPNIAFDETDLSEKYFTYFDQNNVKVIVQVEPADADLKTLMDIIFKRYGKHQSIVGFGIDGEWYQCHLNEWGKKVTDEEAKQWEAWVKTYNSSYILMLKHPDKNMTYLPPSYRGEIIFVNDCEARAKKSDPGVYKGYQEEFLPVMKSFADKYNPNLTIFQIGYPTTKPLWKDFPDPPKKVGSDILALCKQNIGIFWVDFGMKGILPFDDVPTGIEKHMPFTMLKNNSTMHHISVFSLNGQLLSQFRLPAATLQRDGIDSYLHHADGVVVYQIDNGVFTKSKKFFKQNQF